MLLWTHFRQSCPRFISGRDFLEPALEMPVPGHGLVIVSAYFLMAFFDKSLKRPTGQPGCMATSMLFKARPSVGDGFFPIHFRF